MDFVDRAKAIVLTPQTEWRKIETEPGDAAFLFTEYVARLAAIPAVCGFIGSWLIGRDVPGFGMVRAGFFSALGAAILSYILAFVMVYAIAMIIDGLAPTFNAQKNQTSALKLATYSMTPAWLVGVFALVPGLRVLGILGLYGLYLFWLGVPMLMKAPQEKAMVYTGAVVICGVILSLVIAFLVNAIA